MRTVAVVAHHSRFLDLAFWRDYAITMRPYLLFVSGITGIAGVSLASSVPTPAVLVLGLALFLSYGFGQALTDCFQTDTDRLSAPYRPLVTGSLVPQDVMGVSLIGLGAIAVVVVAYNPASALPAALAVVGVATYTWFKRRWWAGPWYNAWIVSVLVLVGYQGAAGAAGQYVVRGPALSGTMLAALAAYANFVLTGYYKDIAADRATGYRTLPVVFGRRISAWVSDGLAAMAFVGAGIALSDTPREPRLIVAIPFLVAAAAYSIVAQWRLHRVRSDEGAHRAIVPVVHSYVLLLAGLASAHQPAWSPFLVGFYLVFVWAMHHRPMAAQI